MKKGLVIAGLGIPGSGKSSVMKELAKQLNCEVFFEPEDSEWPSFIGDRQVSGYFTAISWFRNVRVPQLFRAHALAEMGQTVVVDSYFDKSLYCCIDEPTMDWLIPKMDPYFPVVKKLMEADWNHLPNADVLVNFSIEKNDWLELIRGRGRSFDRLNGVEGCFGLQELFHRAAIKLSEEFGIKTINFKQEISSPEEAAQKLHQHLKSHGLEI